MSEKTLKYIGYTLNSLCIAALLFYAYSSMVGDNLALPWQVETTFKTRPLLLKYFQINGEDAGIFIDQILSWQQYFTGDIQFLGWTENVLVIAFLITLISITTLISYFDRFSYFIIAGVVVFALIQLRLEELGILRDYLTYSLVGAFLLSTYLFQAFFPSTKLWVRLLTATLLYGVLAFLILTADNIQYAPWVSISYGLIAPLVFISIFILFIAGDNIYSLFRLTTSGSGSSKNGLIHFSIIGLIYVSLPALLFLQRTGNTNFDIYFLGPEFLLIASLISGYISLDDKFKAFNLKIDLSLIKNWLYPSGVILTLVMLGFAKLTINDALLNAIEWLIILSHLAFGVGFYFYAIINFLPPLVQKMEVWPIFFRGLRTPILMVRLMSFALFLGGIFYLEYRPYYQAKSGQFAMLAALGEKVDNSLLADQYYKQSVFNDFYNFKANYSLTRMAEKEFEVMKIPQKLFSVLQASPSPKARVAFANFYGKRENRYQELSTLMNTRELSDSKEVRNNIGIAHYRYTNYDSALNYFSVDVGDPVSEGNLAALNYDFAAQVSFDTAFDYSATEDINLLINRQALSNAQNGSLSFKHELAADTLLDRAHLFYLYNAAVGQNPDQPEEILTALNYYLTNPKNELYYNFLITSKSILLYHMDQINAAFNTLNQVIASNNNDAGFPYFLKAVWAYDQGNADMCIEALELSQKRGFKDPQLKQFIDKIKTVRDYQEHADISEVYTQLQMKKSDEDGSKHMDALKEIANQNAFDQETTLKAITELRQLGVEEQELYNLLLEAIGVNVNGIELIKAYIFSCADLSYEVFAESAFGKLQDLVSLQEYYSVQQVYNQKLDAAKERRLQLLNQNQ